METVSIITNKGLNAKGEPPGETELNVILKFFTKSRIKIHPHNDKANNIGNHIVLVNAPTKGTNL